MKFLVDAQLPRRLASELVAMGHDAIHTLDLPDQNLAQLDNLFLHGGLKEGEGFSLQQLLVDIAAGALQGKLAAGPEAAEADPDLASLEKMVDGLADDPAVAAMLENDPDWLDIYASNPEIMRIVAASSTPTATFAVSPKGVAEMVSTVQQVVVEVKAPEALAMYTQKAFADHMVDLSVDFSKEDIKKLMEFKVEEAGGPAAVQHMTPAELQHLADQIAASVPSAAKVAVP